MHFYYLFISSLILVIHVSGSRVLGRIEQFHSSWQQTVSLQKKCTYTLLHWWVFISPENDQHTLLCRTRCRSYSTCPSNSISASCSRCTTKQMNGIQTQWISKYLLLLLPLVLNHFCFYYFSACEHTELLVRNEWNKTWSHPLLVSIFNSKTERRMNRTRWQRNAFSCAPADFSFIQCNVFICPSILTFSVRMECVLVFVFVPVSLQDYAF